MIQREERLERRLKAVCDLSHLADDCSSDRFTNNMVRIGQVEMVASSTARSLLQTERTLGRDAEVERHYT